MNPGVIACLLLLACAAVYADDYLTLFNEAAAYTQRGQYDQAVTKYKAALAIRPSAPEALNNLAVMYYQLRRYSDAFDIASGIWASHPELRSAALIAGMSAVQCNRPREAIAPLHQLLNFDPHNRDALLALASANVALNNFDKAARIYDRQIALSIDDSAAWYGRAICYERMAETASKKLSQMPGGVAYSKRLLAEYLQSSGDAKMAREAFGESASSGPSSPEASRQYETARELAQKSRESFERLIQIAPDSWQAAVFLGDVDRQHGNLTGALGHYQKAADLQRGNPAPLLGLGTAYWEMGDFDRASAYLHQTLAINPDASQALFELANIAVRHREDAQAIPLLKQYLSAQPDALAARADLGRAYSHLAQYEDAVRELTRALPSDERGDLHYELSVALRKLGHTSEADIALQKSKELRQAQLQREQRIHSDR